VTFHAVGVTKIEITTIAINAQMYQQEFCAQSAIGPATVHPHKNRFDPGQESLRAGIRFFLMLFLL